MPSLAHAVASTSLALLLTGCGDEEPEIPADAVSEASDIAGSGADAALRLAPADVESLAGQANVEQDVLGSVASSLAEEDVWTRSMEGVLTIYDEAPEGVAPTLVDVACRAAATTIHTDDQLHYAIFQRVSGFDEREIDDLTETTFDLFQVLHDAGDSERAEDRAAAALTCHTLEETRG